MGMRATKFHGRFDDGERECEAPGCPDAGEFRAPSGRGPSFDGPGEYRYFCLDHVREFNAGYDWFEGMSADEMDAAQSPIAGWRTETRAFSSGAGSDGTPRWMDFDDPLDAIGARVAGIKARARDGANARANGTARKASRFTAREREALSVLGLGPTAERAALRRRYSELVRRYHPDRNGGDRSHEGRLQRVVEAYQVLRRAEAMA